MSSRDTDTVVEADDDLKLPGPLRRNWKLLLALLAALVVGPLVSRLIDGYRAVILERTDTRAYLFWESRPPRWVNDIAGAPGTIVVKVAGEWAPKPAPATPTDEALATAYHRYQQAYRGRVTEIRPPAYPKGPSVAVIMLDDGTSLELPIWSQALAAIAVGSRVRKEAGSWDPILVEDDGAAP